MIISASRRTDIPAFHFSWFLERMQAGFAEVVNPFNPAMTRRVSLAPRDVDCVVFWTKDARPAKDFAAFELFGVPYFALYTLTPYGPDIEPAVRGKEGIIASFKNLAARIGSARLLWRYDPVILTPSWTAARHLREFERLAAALEGSVRRCVTSFVQPYKRIRANLAALGWIEPDAGERFALLDSLARIAANHGISLQTCAAPDSPPPPETPSPETQPELFPRPDSGPAAPRFSAGACIDARLITRVLGKPLLAGKAARRRPACLCAASVDIGGYGSCNHGCVYCYAGSTAPASSRIPNS